MISAGTVFTRLDAYLLSEKALSAEADRLGLPHLPPCVANLELLQARQGSRNARRYLLDLVRQGWFEIICPSKGNPLRSGASLVLVDKTVVFSFPENRELLLCLGDLGLGFPICAMLLTDKQIWIGVTANAWGFAERHLAGMAKVIKTTGWAPGPATGSLRLLLGDSNFAHHAWNQLSGLEDLTATELTCGRIEMVATHQPLGPINEIIPEVAKWHLSLTPDVSLEALNAPGAVFAPVGGHFITEKLIERILAAARNRVSQEYREISSALLATEGPILWASVRTRNRTAANQHEMLVALGFSFLSAAPTGAIVIDGHSLSVDISESQPFLRDEAIEIVQHDSAAAEAVKAALVKSLGPEARDRVHVAVGLSITDSILLSSHAAIYFCHHGTVQHKIGWFNAIPGVVHCNKAILAAAPSAYVAGQSEVAIAPYYLRAENVEDCDFGHATQSEFSHLLLHENYRFTNILATVSAFFSHARASGISIHQTEETTMSMTEKALSVFNNKPSVRAMLAPATRTALQADETSPSSFARPANRHLLQAPENLIPTGTLYTDFFRFIDANLRPRAYFEIGTHLGRSVKAFTCNAVCVDPHFMLDQDVLSGRLETHFYQMPSDTFFSQHDLRIILKTSPDVCFLDGMHRSEYLLRDFINTERHCHRRSIIFMHDCLPVNSRMALRTHELGDESEGHWRHAWTGDVWKVVPLLKSHRPDLKIFYLDCAPTGLVAVTNLDPGSTALGENYSMLVDELRAFDLDSFTTRRLWEHLPVIKSQSLLDHPEDLTLFLNIY